MEKLIKSRERVSKFAEVYTPSFLVKDMCDLVGDILKELRSKVLEPACGNGNFLVEILDRKLSLITHNFELNALIAVSSLYGIDIQELKNIYEEQISYLYDLEDLLNKNQFSFGYKEKMQETIKELLNDAETYLNELYHLKSLS